MPAMEQLISDIEAHCAACGISPQKLLREAINAKWGQWQDWKDGKSSPTMKVVDRLRAHMAGAEMTATGHGLVSQEEAKGAA
ncbi:hypothetical protein GQF56_15420 [Rhodobacter sphaeroides]|uniref:Uncharacterized protein n=2 Tax=Cereibacter sphaeroides TaxID=1063 RepID=U5NMZ6_CERS4|nr:hypothetical protein RSP_7623 [Cereibacter sphaeroides 2.4.1]AXC63684.1 hypothetical protein DQL45_20145 [Cereibacter sphaeroides 2.4.1]MVX49240.1 hypothetical protein [Cereibacter sphaeroides]